MNVPRAPDPVEPPRIVIVGGGIAGLAAAWELEPQSRAGALAVDLFEASSRVGGPIASHRESGHLLEGGPDCFLTTKPSALQLCEELGLSASLIGVRPSARRAYIYREGRLHRIPPLIGPARWASLRSLLSSTLLSPAGRLRMALGGALVRLRPIRVDERFALGPQLRSRFGVEAVDWLLEPFVSGVHPAPLDVLSTSVVANVLPSRWLARTPRVANERSRSFPSVSSRRGTASRLPTGPFVSLREGMEELPRTLAARLSGAKLHLAQPVLEIRPENGHYVVALAEGRSIVADGVILAVPPPRAAKLVVREFPSAAARLEEMRMESVAVVAAVFDRAEVPIPLDGSGVLVPRRTGGAASAFTWLSAKWDRPSHPSGHIALRVFLRTQPGASDLPSEERAVDLAREGLREVMGITASPRYVTVFLHPAALAWYDVGHAGRVREVRRILGARPGLELAGGSYDGIGIPDAIRSGREAARRVGAPGGPTGGPGRGERPLPASASSRAAEGPRPVTVGSAS